MSLNSFYACSYNINLLMIFTLHIHTINSKLYNLVLIHKYAMHYKELYIHFRFIYTFTYQSIYLYVLHLHEYWRYVYSFIQKYIHFNNINLWFDTHMDKLICPLIGFYACAYQKHFLYIWHLYEYWRYLYSFIGKYIHFNNIKN